MGPRTSLAATLVIAGVTLLVAIAIGNEMGNRVLGQATERGPAIAATPVATPVPSGTNGPGLVTWKREQILSVATDPGFPDPRVTPPPPPTPPPMTPVPRRLPTPPPPPPATPAPTPTRSRAPYTSPPLPLPLLTHGVNEAQPQTSPSPTPEPSASVTSAPTP